MKKLKLVLAAAVVFVAVLVSHCVGLLDVFEKKSYDSRINFTANFSEVNQDIAFVMIDQESINEALKEYGWGWPWPRKAYAEIVDFLTDGNASSITFDVLFTEPSVYGNSDDESFSAALERNGKSVVAQFWNGVDGEKSSILKPIDSIANAAKIVANTTSITDSDGIIRRTRVFDEKNGEGLLNLGFAPLVSGDKDFDISEYAANAPLKLKYKGSIDRYAHYSAIDVLRSAKGGEDAELFPEDFEDCHVFILFYAPGLFDICATPISKTYPGSGVAITALDNILSDCFIKTIPGFVNIILILIAVLLGAIASSFVSTKSQTSTATILTLAFVVGFPLLFAAVCYALFFGNIEIVLVAPIVGFLISYSATTFINYLSEGKQKRFIKSAFSQYLSPHVINQLIADPKQLKLGGEKRNISIFFSDVQSFTTLSESLTPEKLTELLNKYLTAMSEIILETGGTIDKYEGDAIIAFWNAPSNIENHPNAALKAAISCQKKLKEMEAEFVAEVGRPMWTRIGLNTGDAVVGNMGSVSRFDYTMFGDAVNLSSRLEGINKQFGTFIICSEMTRDAAVEKGCDFYFREIARVQVVGKTKAVTIFEPMAREDFEANKEKIETFGKGLNLFYEGKLAEAKSIFESNKGDAPSEKYSKKCDELMDSVDENWKGVWVATSK